MSKLDFNLAILNKFKIEIAALARRSASARRRVAPQ